MIPKNRGFTSDPPIGADSDSDSENGADGAGGEGEDEVDPETKALRAAARLQRSKPMLMQMK